MGRDPERPIDAAPRAWRVRHGPGVPEDLTPAPAVVEDATTGDELVRRELYRYEHLTAALSPDGRYVIVDAWQRFLGDEDHAVSLYDARTGELRYRLDPVDPASTFLDGGTLVQLLHWEGLLRRHEIEQGGTVRQAPLRTDRRGRPRGPAPPGLSLEEVLSRGRLPVLEPEDVIP
jgi:hypothetical protein